MSLRKMARILGVSPAYLSRMVNGKRPWNPEIRQRYEELVSATVPKFGNTFGNTTQLATLSGGAKVSHHDCLQGEGIVAKTCYNLSAKSRGAVAQLGERFNGIEEVGGSSPPSSTKFLFRYEF